MPWEIIDEYASQKLWIGDLIQLAGSINIVISIKAKERNYRQDDKSIMGEFIKHGIRGNELRILNNICMNMQVTMMSEICNAKGDKIEEWAWKCRTQLSKKQW